MRNRNNVIVVHLNDKEYDRLNKKCQQAGLRREQFARAVLEGANVTMRPPESYKDLARELAAIGNNINQAVHLANSTGYISRAQIEYLSSQMTQVWRLVQERV